MKALLVAILLSGCARTRLDCIDICKERGLKFVEMVPATTGYDRVEQKEHTKNVCRCEYGGIPK